MLHNCHLPIFEQIIFFSADVANLKFQKLLRNFFVCLFVFCFLFVCLFFSCINVRGEGNRIGRREKWPKTVGRREK